jgi:ubiquinone/menaquinone biosynthesis C-methylase UbiE
MLNVPQIKEMWSRRAVEVDRSDQVTHWDVHQRQLEIRELARHLQPDDLVRDMGCGNGWSTVQLAAHCRQIIGVDYSEQMITRARADYGGSDSVAWLVGDALTFDATERYDAVITIRCLINIVDAELQRKAIANLHRSLKSGGRLLLMEGIADGRAELSRLREAVGLTALPQVVHNLDFPLAATVGYLRTLFRTVEVHRNGVYDLVTRVLYPLMIQPEAPAYGTPFHEAATAMTAAVGGLEQVARFGLFKCVK